MPGENHTRTALLTLRCAGAVREAEDLTRIFEGRHGPDEGAMLRT